MATTIRQIRSTTTQQAVQYEEKRPKGMFAAISGNHIALFSVSPCPDFSARGLSSKKKNIFMWERERRHSRNWSLFRPGAWVLFLVLVGHPQTWCLRDIIQLGYQNIWESTIPQTRCLRDIIWLGYKNMRKSTNVMTRPKANYNQRKNKLVQVAFWCLLPIASSFGVGFGRHRVLMFVRFITLCCATINTQLDLVSRKHPTKPGISKTPN